MSLFKIVHRSFYVFHLFHSYALLIHVVHAIHVVLWLFLVVFVDSDRVEVFFVFGSFWSF